MTYINLPEQHRRLGRHVDHDERSRDFPAGQAPALRSVLHDRTVPAFDQGALGSCTAHAAFGLMVTAPDTRPGFDTSESRIVQAYGWQTAHDNVPGTYPPDDTGSSGLAAAKYLKYRGWIKSYTHAFGLQHALAALMLGPVITGVSWYEGFDQPDGNGYVAVAGAVRGGHEFEVLGVDVTAKRVLAINSWGPGWGDKGRFQFSWDTWDRLLADSGDVTTVR